MNPSASGWIPKYIATWNDISNQNPSATAPIAYETVRNIGFIYGVSTASFLSPLPTKLKLSFDEYTKINLFHLLVDTFYQHTSNANAKEAVRSILAFYKTIEKGKQGFFNQFSIYGKSHSRLERILSVRIHDSNSLLKRNFTTLLTYAFLYVDVLAYRVFLNEQGDARKFVTDFEAIVMQACFDAVQSKQKKNKYDRLLIELFEANVWEFNTKKAHTLFVDSIQKMTLEQRKYILDLSCLAIWDDHTMDASEQQYIMKLCETLQLPDDEVSEVIATVINITQKNSVSVKLFEYAHPVSQFYKQATKTVKTLIVRNKSRLLTELEESGELLVLLGKSTTRELSKAEKTKVREQLIDICKTIPSLTIFLLPGGTLLLPLLIKFIPKLLPSAFDDNRIEKDS
ncbi:MAG: LETM1-related biofilm-associated protein [Marinirhabdus sp.]|nr:LETM1-related biofilm-associated protein [Marinirhabdus sp.]